MQRTAYYSPSYIETCNNDTVCLVLLSAVCCLLPAVNCQVSAGSHCIACIMLYVFTLPCLAGMYCLLYCLLSCPVPCRSAMKGVNGQQILMDTDREIVCVKLSSQPTYVDDAMDVTSWAGYEAIVRELTDDSGYSMRG